MNFSPKNLITFCVLWLAVLAVYAQKAPQKNDFHLAFSTQKDTIKQLDLVYFALTEIPAWVYDCKNLQTLNISGNMIRKLPKKLNKLKKLNKIIWNSQLNSTLLTQIDTAKLRQLESIEAWKYLSQTKSAVAKQELLVSPLDFKIGRLKRVKHLAMNENYLTKIPRQVRKIRHLDTLLLSNNSFTQLPTKGFNQRLQHLILNYNQINLREEDDFSVLKNLKSLYFIFNRIDNIPTQITALQAIENLNFSNNLLTNEKIKADFATLPNLRVLSFYKNNLRSIPTSILGVPQLEELDLYYNQIDTISPQIAVLQQLKSLALAHNQLKSLPKEIEQLKQLTQIYVHHNQLQTLPIDFSYLPKLEVFHAEFNQLKIFPVGLSKINSMKSIDLAYNKLLNIVGNITQLPHLEYLNLRDNPVSTNEKVRSELENFAKKLAGRGTRVIY